MSVKQNGWTLHPKALVSVFCTCYIFGRTHKASVRGALLSGKHFLPQQLEHEAAGDIASAVRKKTATTATANPLIFIQSTTSTHEKVPLRVKEDPPTSIKLMYIILQRLQRFVFYRILDPVRLGF